jgi:hypothetical protein
MNINSSLVSMRREDGVIVPPLLFEMLLPPGLSSLVFVLLVSPDTISFIWRIFNQLCSVCKICCILSSLYVVDYMET